MWFQSMTEHAMSDEKRQDCTAFLIRKLARIATDNCATWDDRTSGAEVLEAIITSNNENKREVILAGSEGIDLCVLSCSKNL